MRSLQAGDVNFDLNDKIPDRNGFLNENSQKAITILRHQIAVQKAFDMIRERIQDLPTLSELAKSTGLSRTYLSFVFKEVTGMRLQDYVTHVRLEKAKYLLGNIDLKIKQIAHEAGFSDPNYFCRSFKRKTGLNPTRWRLINIFKWPGS